MKIPRERIAPIIEDWCRKFDVDHPTPGFESGERAALQALGFQSNVSARRLRMIVDGGNDYWRGKRVPFTHVTPSMADKVITAIDSSLWHTDLADLYEAAA